VITDTPRSQASASGVWLAARTSASRLRLAFTRSATLGPVAIVALALTVLVAQRLSAVHGNPSGLILFGSHFVQFTHPLAGAPAPAPVG
jgi:hypothetical protein